MTRVEMMTQMSWEVDEEVNQDENGEVDGMNLEVDCKIWYFDGDSSLVQ